ncbi:MAG: phosphoribosylanthranilate isomerase [Lachnospiraceae bacterium]|nr:phosphoribosylanthranilate isomerase [Lachnospiraceae bacterium]
MKIKICGLSREEDILCANEIRPDFIGFVFAPKSRRYVSPKQAERLRRLLSPEIVPVGVFVNEEPELAAELLNEGVIGMAQLHGQEDEAYIRRLRALTEKPLIQAFRIDTRQDAERAECSGADYILLDHGAGGTGESFDWSLLKDVKRPYFLAGGLNPDNAARALQQAKPYALDVSSGVETGGVKDPEKMRAFVRQVRQACGTAASSCGRPVTEQE